MCELYNITMLLGVIVITRMRNMFFKYLHYLFNNLFTYSEITKIFIIHRLCDLMHVTSDEQFTSNEESCVIG